MPLQILKGGLTEPKQFVCPWCGATFDHRFITSDGVLSLEEHWVKNKQCGANRNVNNPTQTKYRITDPNES